MAHRLAQADAFQFLGTAIILVAIYLVFIAFDPMAHLLRPYLAKLFGLNSVAPEPVPDGKEGGEEKSEADKVKEWEPPKEKPSLRDDEQAQRQRTIDTGIKLIGIPEFDIAVRSKLLVGPNTYLIQDVPQYGEAFEAVQDEHAASFAALAAK